MLKIFEPRRFPIANWDSFFTAAYILANNSGKLVPNATKVIEITLSLTPILFAIFLEELIILSLMRP